MAADRDWIELDKALAEFRAQQVQIAKQNEAKAASAHAQNHLGEAAQELDVGGFTCGGRQRRLLPLGMPPTWSTGLHVGGEAAAKEGEASFASPAAPGKVFALGHLVE